MELSSASLVLLIWNMHQLAVACTDSFRLLASFEIEQEYINWLLLQGVWNAIKYR